MIDVQCCRPMWLLPRLCILLVAAITPCVSRITEVSLSDDSRSSVALALPFGFVDAETTKINAGHHTVAISVTDAQATWAPSAPEIDRDYGCFRLAVVSTRDELMRLDEKAVEGICEQVPSLWELSPIGLSDAWKTIVFSFSQETDIISDGKLLLRPEFSVTASGLSNQALYTPYFVNCCSDIAAVSLEAETTLYNEVDGVKNYLSRGEMQLPWLSVVMSLLYMTGLALYAWAFCNNRASNSGIHYLVMSTILFKAASLITEAGMWHSLSITGRPGGWGVAFYILAFLRSSSLYQTLFIVGSGWAYIPRFLGDYQRAALMVLLPVQVLFELLNAVFRAGGMTPGLALVSIWWSTASGPRFYVLSILVTIMYYWAWISTHALWADSNESTTTLTTQELRRVQCMRVLLPLHFLFSWQLFKADVPLYPGPRLSHSHAMVLCQWVMMADALLMEWIAYTTVALLFWPRQRKDVAPAAPEPCGSGKDATPSESKGQDPIGNLKTRIRTAPEWIQPRATGEFMVSGESNVNESAPNQGQSPGSSAESVPLLMELSGGASSEGRRILQDFGAGDGGLPLEVGPEASTGAALTVRDSIDADGDVAAPLLL